jgi:hypothetical protein
MSCPPAVPAREDRFPGASHAHFHTHHQPCVHHLCSRAANGHRAVPHSHHQPCVHHLCSRAANGHRAVPHQPCVHHLCSRAANGHRAVPHSHHQPCVHHSCSRAANGHRAVPNTHTHTARPHAISPSHLCSSNGGVSDLGSHPIPIRVLVFRRDILDALEPARVSS